jgi:hypothetical protein
MFSLEMKVLTGLLVVVTIAVAVVCGKSLLLMSEKAEDCTKGGGKFGDWSRVEYVYLNDTTYYLNGEI